MVRISNIELLNILKDNARMKFVDIAKKLNVSETAIRKKVKKLEENGTIKGYTIEINPKKAGFEINAMIGIDTKPEYFIQILEGMKKMPECLSVYSASGDHMILIECWFKDSKALTVFVQGIEKIEGITKICPAIITEKIK